MLTRRYEKKFSAAVLMSSLVGYAIYLLLHTAQDLNQNKLMHSEGEIQHDVNKVRVINPKDIPVTHVAFLKVHKTASSTAQNVFLRFGASRNLSFILPHYRGESGFLNVISFGNSLTDKNVVPPSPGSHFDILCCHVIYNYKSFRRFLPENTVNIGIVREPISRFQSAVKFFTNVDINKIYQMKGDHPVTTYAENPLKYENSDPRNSQLNNRMAVEFGFPLNLFPGRIPNDSKTVIDKYLRRLGHEFKLIIIKERFDESMVYMKRILHWTIKDVLYMVQNRAEMQQSPRILLTESDKMKINKFLYLDNAIYDFSVKKFEKQIAAEGQDFIKEVEHFRKVRVIVEQYCKSEGKKTLEIEKSEWDSNFTLSKPECNLFYIQEKAFIQSIRQRMYGTLKN